MMTTEPSQVSKQFEEVQDLVELHSIRKSITSITSLGDLDELLARIVESSVALTGAEEAYLLLVDQGTGALYLRAGQRLGEKYVQEFRLRVSDSIAGSVVKTGKPVMVNNKEGLEIKTGHIVKSLLNVPLKVGEEVIGVLCVDHKVSDKAFSEDNLNMLLILADYAAIAIENARLFDEAKQHQRLASARTILAWMGMVSSSWRHAIDKHALTIREQMQLLQMDLDNERLAQISARISMVERLATQIIEKPITPPLSTEEGVESMALNALIGERAEQLWQNHPYNATELKLNLCLPKTATVWASPEWLRRAFDELVDNAVEAVANCEVQEITIGTRAAREGAEIFVSDTGPGVLEEIRAKIGLERIEKPKGAKGLGIGLLMTQMIVKTYGGELKLESTGPTGTVMVIWLPLEE